MSVGQDLKFEYNHDMTHDWNFDKWYRWNCRERRSYNLEIYTETEALFVFNELFPKPNLKTMETEWTL